MTYPALYEAFFHKSLQHLIFRCAFWLHPDLFFYGSMLWLTFGLLLLVLRIKQMAATVRWPLLIAAFLCFLSFGASYFFSSSKNARVKHPDVLFIAIDSLRTDRFLDPSITPAFYEMSFDRRSVQFNDHFVGTIRTFPSWIEMIQGAYSAHTGIRHMFPNFKERSELFAGFVSQMKDAGYQTRVISDFAGDIFPRFQAGFDRIDTPNLNVDTIIQMNMVMAFPFFTALFTNDLGVLLFPELKESPAFSDADDLTLKAKKAFAADSDDQPRFITLFYSTAHFPYAAPWPWYTRYTDKNYQGPFWFQKNPDLYVSKAELNTQEHITQIRALYDGSVSSIDASLSHLFLWLKKNGKWDNTLIVITADHGADLYEYPNQHGHGEHLLGPHVAKVPLLIKLHDTLPLPKKNKILSLSRSVDLAPTLLDLLKLPSLEQTDGASLKPLIEGEKDPLEPRIAYSETGLWFSRTSNVFFQKQRLDYPAISELISFDPSGSKEMVLDHRFRNIVVAAKHRSFIEGPYKLVYAPTPYGAQMKLYNRELDPYNEIDISAQQPEVYFRLKNQFLEFVCMLEKNQFEMIQDFLIPR